MRSLRLAIASFIFGLAGCNDTQTGALMPSANDSSSQAKVLAWLEKYPTAIWLNYNNTGSSVREYVREQMGSFSSKHSNFHAYIGHICDTRSRCWTVFCRRRTNA